MLDFNTYMCIFKPGYIICLSLSRRETLTQNQFLATPLHTLSQNVMKIHVQLLQQSWWQTVADLMHTAQRQSVLLIVESVDVEELDGGPTLFQCFAVHYWGQWDFAFFGQKIGTVQRSGLPFGSIIGGTPRIATTFFRRGKFL